MLYIKYYIRVPVIESFYYKAQHSNFNFYNKDLLIFEYKEEIQVNTHFLAFSFLNIFIEKRVV